MRYTLNSHERLFPMGTVVSVSATTLSGSNPAPLMVIHLLPNP